MITDHNDLAKRKAELKRLQRRYRNRWASLDRSEMDRMWLLCEEIGVYEHYRDRRGDGPDDGGCCAMRDISHD